MYSFRNKEETLRCVSVCVFFLRCFSNLLEVEATISARQQRLRHPDLRFRGRSTKRKPAAVTDTPIIADGRLQKTLLKTIKIVYDRAHRNSALVQDRMSLLAGAGDRREGLRFMPQAHNLGTPPVGERNCQHWQRRKTKVKAPYMTH